MVVVEKFMMLIYKLAALVQSDTTNLKSPDLGHITFDPSMIFDNQGIVISIVGYVIVFASLVFLYFVVSSLGRYFLKQQKKKLAEESGGKEYDESSFDVPGEI
ncbi:MAG: OadG family protein, partial [Bacteroidota bacterium]